MRKLATAAIVAALGLAACGPRLIPGTNIEATDDNEAILRVVADYKTAYEAKDVPGILKLVSPNFYETNGTPDPSDDYDYKGLERILTDEFKSVAQPALDLDVRKVSVARDTEDKASVDYYYASRFQLADAGANGGFKTAADVAEMKFARENGTWKITGGI